MQVIPALKNGGVEIETIEIGKAILLAGGRALIASDSGDMAKEAESKGIELKKLPLGTKNPFLISKNANLLKDLIQQEKIDIVHARSRAPAWSAYKASRALGVPFVTTYHAAHSSKTVFKTFYNSVMARGDRVIAISQFIFDHLVKTYQKYSWFDSSNLRLIPRGIDVAYFDPASCSPQKVQALRKKWGISPSTRVLLLPGRITRTKGQDLLIKALPLMKHKDVMAVFVGSAQGHETYQEALAKLAISLGIEDRVKWIPPFPDLSLVYHLADIVVCPSLVPEGFGRVIVEAQAMQKPVIASNHGAAPEVMKDGVSGWLVPPRDEEAIAQAVDQALALPQDYLDRMGQEGRAHVIASFTEDLMFSKTMALYEEVLNTSRHS